LYDKYTAGLFVVEILKGSNVRNHGCNPWEEERTTIKPTILKGSNINRKAYEHLHPNLRQIVFTTKDREATYIEFDEKYLF